jgi:hypothetical protein
MTEAQSHAGAVAVSLSASVVLLVSAIVGLVAWRTIYKSETAALVDSAAAQDVVSVAVAVLLMVTITVAVRTGSTGATLVWVGLLSFVAYNAAIYCFSVHFGPLFLAWTVVLGLSVFGAVITSLAVESSTLTSLLPQHGAKIVAWVLIGASVIFALLWLREIVPDLLAGRPSSSAVEWHVPTNPVHVLDLALFLPAVMVSGVLILRSDPLGLTLGVPALVWMILTCLPILVTPLMARARGHSPEWSAVPPVAFLLVIFLAAGVLLVRDALDH